MDTKKHESAVEALSQAISILVDTFSISNNVEGINPTEKQKTIVEALTEMRDNILHYSVRPNEHISWLQNENDRKSNVIAELSKSNEELRKRILQLVERDSENTHVMEDAIMAANTWREVAAEKEREKQVLRADIAKLKEENDTLYRNAKKSEKQYEFYLSINN